MHLSVKPPASVDLELLPGTRIGGQAMQVDLVPRVLDMLGAARDASLPGTSWLVRALFAPDQAGSTAYSAVRQHGHIRRGVFEGDWKRIRADAPYRVDLLFDLSEDAWERDNRFGRARTPLEHLDAVLASYEERGAVAMSLALDQAMVGD